MNPLLLRRVRQLEAIATLFAWLGVLLFALSLFTGWSTWIAIAALVPAGLLMIWRYRLQKRIEPSRRKIRLRVAVFIVWVALFSGVALVMSPPSDAGFIAFLIVGLGVLWLAMSAADRLEK